MSRTENKTKPTSTDIKAFLSSVAQHQRADAEIITQLMTAISGEKPVIWGTMVGFGFYHYKYASGREGDTFKMGFAPRKMNLTLYVLNGFSGQDELLAKLGSHTTGKVCLYIKKLADVDMTMLREIIKRSWHQDIENISYN